MDSRSQWEALAIVKICFDTTRAAALGGVEMNGNENGVAISVSDRNTCSECHEHITVASHHHAIPACCQRLFQSLRDVQGHLLFCNHLAGNPAAVVAAMTRIDDYSDRRSTVLRSALRLSRGKSPQKCD